MRHRLTWFEDQTLWTVDVEAESESAARQAWVDGALPRPEALVCGIDLIDRMDCDKVTGLDAARLFNVLLVDFDWPPPTPSTWNDPKPGPTGRNVLPAPPKTVGDIREWLGRYDDNMPVVMADGRGWYSLIGHLDGPTWDGTDLEWDDSATGYSLPTIFHGDSFDSRLHLRGGTRWTPGP